MSNEEFEEALQELKEDLEKSEEISQKTILALSLRLKEDVKKAIDLQSDIINYRQILTYDIKKIAYKIYKDIPIIKKLRKTQFEYYTLKYTIKTNATEKVKLIEADLALYDYKIDIYNNHMEFLKECCKNLDSMNYAVKNKIELLNAIGIE
jgi:hypothetical protein